eukprot:4816560-Ditylum_brightwellii.AAC.1
MRQQQNHGTESFSLYLQTHQQQHPSSTSWEDIWKDVLVLVPLDQTFLEDITAANKQDSNVVPSVETPVDSEKPEGDAKNSIMGDSSSSSALLEHAAILSIEGASDSSICSNDPQPLQLNQGAMIGFLPLSFFNVDTTAERMHISKDAKVKKEKKKEKSNKVHTSESAIVSENADTPRRTSSRIRLKQQRRDRKDSEDNHDDKEQDSHEAGEHQQELEEHTIVSSLESESWRYLRQKIRSCLQPEDESDSSSSSSTPGDGKQGKSRKKAEKTVSGKKGTTKELDETPYTCAPLGQIWIHNIMDTSTTNTTEKNENEESSKEEGDTCSKSNKNASSSSSPSSNAKEAKASSSTNNNDDVKEEENENKIGWITSIKEPPPLDN